MRITLRNPNVRAGLRNEAERHQHAMNTAAHIATDRASREAQQQIRSAMRSAGLGKLTQAVGQTSSLRKRAGTPYGVIYAKGGDESRAGGALEAYSQGATITARSGKWLAFPTRAVQRMVGKGRGRRRLTPSLYKSSGLEASLGRLHFRPAGNGMAYLIARNVTLHPRTGRAKAAGTRAPRTRIPAKEVIVFVLIRFTRRAKRFDKDSIVSAEAARVPDYLAEELLRLFS